MPNVQTTVDSWIRAIFPVFGLAGTERQAPPTFPNRVAWRELGINNLRGQLARGIAEEFLSRFASEALDQIQLAQKRFEYVAAHCRGRTRVHWEERKDLLRPNPFWLRREGPDQRNAGTAQRSKSAQHDNSAQRDTPARFELMVAGLHGERGRTDLDALVSAGHAHRAVVMRALIAATNRFCTETLTEKEVRGGFVKNLNLLVGLSDSIRVLRVWKALPTPNTFLDGCEAGVVSDPLDAFVSALPAHQRARLLAAVFPVSFEPGCAAPEDIALRLARAMPTAMKCRLESDSAPSDQSGLFTILVHGDEGARDAERVALRPMPCKRPGDGATQLVVVGKFGPERHTQLDLFSIA